MAEGLARPSRRRSQASNIDEKIDAGLPISGRVTNHQGKRHSASSVFVLVFLISFSALAQTSPQSPQYANVDQAMNALWSGQANFQIIRKMRIETYPDSGAPFVTIDDVGTQIVPLNGVWYLFSREYGYISKTQVKAIFGGSTKYCPYTFRIVVRSSIDEGQTWSRPAVLAAPNLNPALLNSGTTECMLVDGKAFWDSTTKTWHYIAQAYDVDSAGNHKWNMNHYTYTPPLLATPTRVGSQSPMARFTPDPGNPVIKSGGIWNRICATRNYTLCPERTASEGTPEISYKANGYYYVTFHGSYHTDKPNKYGVGPVINGYRGIAKTRDFHTWVVDSSGDIPDAPIWGPNDCAKWNVPWNSFTGCIGGGNAASLITPDYTYMLIESADTSLSCTAGQHWVEGLVRNPGANNFAASGKWQQLGDVVNRATPSDSAHPKNPLLNANTAAPCGIQYAAIFTDKDIVYMTYWVFPPTATNENVYFYISRLQPVTERR